MPEAFQLFSFAGGRSRRFAPLTSLARTADREPSSDPAAHRPPSRWLSPWPFWIPRPRAADSAAAVYAGFPDSVLFLATRTYTPTATAATGTPAEIGLPGTETPVVATATASLGIDLTPKASVVVEDPLPTASEEEPLSVETAIQGEAQIREELGIQVPAPALGVPMLLVLLLTFSRGWRRKR